jgi:phage shock protein PspC (stress-responsive transcriptional regulator)
MAEEIKKFYRSRTDRILFGVCGGLGKYFGIDPILFRLLFILLFLMNGAGVILYAIMIFLTHQEPLEHEPGSPETKEDNLKDEFHNLTEKIEEKAHEFSSQTKAEENKMSDSRNLLGGIIIVFGLFFLMKQFFPIAWMNTDVIWALAVIAIGFYIIFKNK